MKNSLKWIIGIVAILVLLLVVVQITGFSIFEQGKENYDEFAKCLASNGVKMYGASWCGHCQNQKKLFGDSWKYVAYVECANADGSQAEECKLVGIDGYPTWVFPDGTKNAGEITLEELALRSKCSLTK